MTDEFKAFAYSLAKCDRNKILSDPMSEFIFKAGVKEGRVQYEKILVAQRDWHQKNKSARKP